MDWLSEEEGPGKGEKEEKDEGKKETGQKEKREKTYQRKTRPPETVSWRVFLPYRNSFHWNLDRR